MSIGENIHNYYDKMVADKLLEKFGVNYTDPDYLADIACVALNHLPPRYYRHEIDMAFYLSPLEHKEMDEKVTAAIANAIDYIKNKRDTLQPE